MRFAYLSARRAALTVVAALAVALAGCASEDDPVDAAASVVASPTETKATPDPSGSTSASSGTSGPPVSTPTPDVTVRIEIATSQVTPSPGRIDVSLGDHVRIEVSGDEADAVHVHGYDLEAEFTDHTPAVVELVADQPGLFEVETHDSGLLLTQLVVQ